MRIAKQMEILNNAHRMEYMVESSKSRGNGPETLPRPRVTSYPT